MVTGAPYVFEHCSYENGADKPLFEIGKSPFHIKGQFYLQQLKWYKRMIERGQADIMRELPPDLREFLSQRFLASAWYDALPFPLITMCEAKVTGRNAREVARQQAQLAAKHSLKNIYKVLIPMFVPGSVVLRQLGGRMVAAVKQFYDFGPCTVLESTDPRVLTMHRVDVPMPMIEWWGINATTFMVEALEILKVKVTCTWSYVPTTSLLGMPVGKVTVVATRTD